MKLYRTTEYRPDPKTSKNDFSRSRPIIINLENIVTIYPKKQQAGDFGPIVEFTVFEQINGNQIYCTELYNDVAAKI